MGTRIVVGVDGSAGSRAAVAYALAEARRRGDAVVEAVMAYPLLTSFPGIEYGVVPVPPETVAASSRQALAAALRDLPTDVPVQQRVEEGSPAHVLIEASHDADLVVLGSRGRGGFRSLLLGSTSHQVASHAHCPVVVIPAHAAAINPRHDADGP